MADNHKHCDRFFTSMKDFCHGIKIVGFYDTLIVFWLTPITTGKKYSCVKIGSHVYTIIVISLLHNLMGILSVTIE